MKYVLFLLLVILFSICILGCELSDDYYLNKIVDLTNPGATSSERELQKSSLKIYFSSVGYTPKQYYDFLIAARNMQY